MGDHPRSAEENLRRKKEAGDALQERFQREFLDPIIHAAWEATMRNNPSTCYECGHPQRFPGLCQSCAYKHLQNQIVEDPPERPDDEDAEAQEAWDIEFGQPDDDCSPDYEDSRKGRREMGE